MKGFIKSILANDSIMRVVHTGWQAFIAVFLIGATGIASKVLVTHTLSDQKSALIALLIAALAAGLSAIKNVIVAKV